MDPKIVVESVVIQGNGRTNLKLFQQSLHDHHIITHVPTTTSTPQQTNEASVKSSYQNGMAIRITDLQRRVRDVVNELRNFGLFEEVDAELVDISHENKSKTIPTPRVKILIKVKEKGIPFLSMSSYVKTGASNAVGAELQAALRNPTGNGEIIKISSANNQFINNSDLNLSIIVPKVHLFGEKSGNVQVSCSSNVDRLNYLSSFDQSVNNFKATYITSDNRFRMTAEYSMRDEVPIMETIPIAPVETYSKSEPYKAFGFSIPNYWKSGSTNVSTPISLQNGRYASNAVLSQAISSLKTSFSYVFTLFDTRQSLPSGGGDHTSGGLFQISGELALPPGDVRYARSELVSQYHYPLTSKKDMVASFACNLGYVLPSERNKPIHLIDRYYMGGPLSLRGFHPSGVGPRSIPSEKTSSDSLGGNFKANCVALLSAPVPLHALVPRWSHGTYSPLRAFAFANAGILSLQHPLSTESASPAQDLFRKCRLSVGSGLSLTLNGAIRLEATYNVNILKASQDQSKPFQIGFGLSINS